MDTRPVVVTVPTELSRSDPFADLSVLFLAIGATWYAANMHVVWLAVPVLIGAAIWTLTGEPAGDVRFIGAVATTLRSRLGLRRAHEWALAWAHYFTVKTWPDFKRWVCKTRAHWSGAIRTWATSVSWLQASSAWLYASKIRLAGLLERVRSSSIGLTLAAKCNVGFLRGRHGAAVPFSEVARIHVPD